jgi:hypothetical protein
LDPLVKKNVPGRFAEYQEYLKKADESFDKAMAIKRQVESKAETKGGIDSSK